MKKLYFISILLFTAINSTYSQSNLWGMTSAGGKEFGTIFKTDADGSNLVTEENFMPGFPGVYPFYSGLCAATNGKFYGMTQSGGIYGLGVLFEYDTTTHTYTIKVNFSGTANGDTPNGGLIQASNGKLYGMTYSGGANGLGVLFEYDPALNTFTKEVDFAGTSNGQNPNGTLVQAANGKLYGMTYSGGTSNYGVLFEYTIATSTLVKKIDFNNNSNGSRPYGSLMLASDGYLYGMTFAGGGNTDGILFMYNTTSGTLTPKITFAGTSNGRFPYGGLVQASSGLMYGLTYMGGATDQGSLFEYNSTSNTLTKKIDFAGTTNGGYPNGNLMLASNGKLYGLTYSGGTLNFGTLFVYDPSTSVLTKKIDLAGAINGSHPRGTLIQGTGGLIFGMTNEGGANNDGILFSYNITSNTITDKIDFSTSPNGKIPQGSLVLASNGKLYGMTNTGGTGNDGVLFEFDPSTYTYVKKIDFAGTSNGKYPGGSLIRASNGLLYGMTSAGGASNYGVLFEYNPATNILTKKVDFSGTASGSNPYGSLVLASNGKLYGITCQGGTSGTGVLFEYNIATSTLTKKADLTGTANGSNPYGSLVQASNNKLYGMTYGGGINGDGVLFEYDPSTGTLTKKIDFAGTTNGSYPGGSLVLASNGNLYGMTYNGGANSDGVLFSYNYTTNTLTKKIDFAGASNGKNPYGTLMQALNGMLYGMTNTGGSNNFGVLFQYDPTLNSLTVKNHFNGDNGRLPYYTNLIEVCAPVIMGTQPVSSTICQGETTAFSLSATGTNLTYQWQVNNGTGFTNISNATPYSGATSNTLNITTATTTMNGYTYQCIISSSCAAQYVSNPTTLTVNSAPIVTAHPFNTSGCPGSNASFIVAASGAGTGYRWQVNTGTGYTDITNAPPYSGATNDTLKLTGITSGMNGYHYRCIVSGTCNPNDTSNAATLSIFATVSSSQSPAICSNQSFTLPDNSSVSAPGTYIDTLQTVHGCDSVITTFLTVYPTQASSQSPVICANDTFVLPDNSIATTGGVYYTTLHSIHGCDSVITTNLSILPVYSIAHYDTICDNGLFYLPDSTVVNTQGTYTTTYQSIMGCDSVIITHLNVNPTFAMTHNPSICNGQNYMLPDSIVVTTTGTYTSNLHTVHGCDSVITTNLTVNPTYAITLSPGICQGETYLLPDGTYANVPGTYNDPFHTIHGCDSNYTIHLSIYPVPATPVMMINADTIYSSSPTGNQWYSTTTGIMTGDTNSYFAPSQNGNYYCIVTVHGCSSDTSAVVSFFSGIDHYSGISNDVLIYPNPVNDQLTIEASGLSTNCHFEIMNITGEVVYHSTLNKKAIVNTESLASGLYLVKIYTNETVIGRRFVKQ